MRDVRAVPRGCQIVSAYPSQSYRCHKPAPGLASWGEDFKESPIALSNTVYLSLVFPNHQLFTNPANALKKWNDKLEAVVQ